jgi:hypothetical protein
MIIRFALLSLATIVAHAQLVVTLSHGSRIVGSTSQDALDIRTEFGELTIPLTRLLDMAGERGRFLIRLRNGDRFTGELRTPQLRVDGCFGEQVIPAGAIRGIRASVLSGIVAWWSADGNAEDRWNTHHGTGDFSLVADRHGRPNSAFNFAESGQIIKVDDHPRLDTPERFSLAAWIRPSAFRGTDGKNPFLISKWYTRPRAGSFLFGLDVQGELRLCVATSEEGFVERELLTEPGSIPLGRWTHVAATFERGQVALYIGGHLAASAYFEDVQRIEPTEYSHDDITIGGFWNKLYNFQGAVDEIMLFNRALSAAEIANLAQD